MVPYRHFQPSLRYQARKFESQYTGILTLSTIAPSSQRIGKASASFRSICLAILRSRCRRFKSYLGHILHHNSQNMYFKCTKMATFYDPISTTISFNIHYFKTLNVLLHFKLSTVFPSNMYSVIEAITSDTHQKCTLTQFSNFLYLVHLYEKRPSQTKFGLHILITFLLHTR